MTADELLHTYHAYTTDEMQQRAAEFFAEMKRRRTVRHFAERAVPHEVIENCLRTAATAPSGANRQPWHFDVGYPAAGARMPPITKKPFGEIVSFV